MRTLEELKAMPQEEIDRINAIAAEARHQSRERFDGDEHYVSLDAQTIEEGMKVLGVDIRL